MKERTDGCSLLGIGAIRRYGLGVRLWNGRCIAA